MAIDENEIEHFGLRKHFDGAGAIWRHSAW